MAGDRIIIMPFYERISAVVSITLIGMAVFFVLDFPTQVTGLILLGSPLSLDAPRRWLMVILLAGMVMAGVDNVVRSHPRLPSARISYVATFWMLPGLLVVLATQTLGLSDSAPIWAASLVGVGGILWYTIVAELRLMEAAPGIWSRLWQQLVGYIVALLFFVVIYNTRSRSAVSATAVMLVSGMTAVALLRQPPGRIVTSWLLAAIIGLSMGQLTWALNYWRIGTLNAGLLLFLVFYLLIGMSQQHLMGKLSSRTFWEFGAIAAVALVVIFSL
jgi:hypothetical protein